MKTIQVVPADSEPGRKRLGYRHVQRHLRASLLFGRSYLFTAFFDKTANLFFFREDKSLVLRNFISFDIAL